MKHFKYFDNETAYNVERNGNYREPWVSWTEERGLDWNKSEDEKMYDEYLTFDVTSNGYINWQKVGSMPAVTIYYSKNDGSWTSVSAATTINVVAGDKVRFKSTQSFFCDWEDDDYLGFGGTTCQFNVYGNIMSMEYGDNFRGQTTLKSAGNDYQSDFGYLFNGCTTLVDASNLILPATTLTNHCYPRMFQGCTSLTKAPKLPATTISNMCYGSMFQGCSSLTTAPELPATSLYQYCYYRMFQGCTSLTTAPVLPARTLISWCYASMFNGCSKLNYVKALFTTTPGSSYTQGWLSSVSSTGTFVKYTTASWSVAGGDGVPTGWTIETAIE